MAKLDAETIESGVGAVELMERAGGVVVDAIQDILSRKSMRPAQVVVVCGPGNNGGDGLVIARRLADEGIATTAVISDANRYSPECQAQMKAFPQAVVLEGAGEVALSACSGKTLSINDFEAKLGSAVVIVDALLGTGQREAPRGAIASLVEAVAAERARRSEVVVVAVDIPTGVDADTGALYTPHIVADHTVSIELLKRGMVQFPGRAACGTIRVVPIEISGRSGIEFSVIEGARIPLASQRPPDAHKGMQGRVLVIGGSAAMPGASALAVLGALRAGAGLVSRAVKPSWTGVAIAPECMNVLIESTQPYFVEDDCAGVVDAIAAADVVVLGPGLGRADETAQFLQGCLNSLRLLKKRAVIDADALALIAAHRLDLRGLEAIITPHPGEAGGLLGITAGEVQRDRFSAVKALFDRYGVVSLLKGAGTLIWEGSQGGIIARGTPYLATAGSGDVLSGILASCLKGSERVFDAALRGAYIHAVAGERASAASQGPIIASDIAWSAASVLGELEK